MQKMEKDNQRDDPDKGALRWREIKGPNPPNPSMISL